VWIHGGSVEDSSVMVADLEPFFGRVRALFPDTRGHGLSSRFERVEDFIPASRVIVPDPRAELANSKKVVSVTTATGTVTVRFGGVAKTVEREDSPQLRGMVHKVRHLVTVEEK